MSENQPTPDVLHSPELPVFNDNPTLQTRLLLGGTALNPEHSITQVDANQFGKAENDKFTHDCLRAGSMDERITFWKGKEGTFDKQKNVWKDHLVTRFKNKKDFYSTTDDGKKQAEALKKIGIDAVNFSTDSAEAVYRKWCNGKDGASNCEEFVTQLVSQYNTIEELQKDLPVFQWFSNIFGAQSGEIIVQMAAAKMKVKDENKKNELITKANEKDHEISRINSPDKNAERHLRFLWAHRPADIAQAAEKDVEKKPETSGTPIEISAARLEELRQQLAMIKDMPDKNNPAISKYFMENPPGKITLSPEQIDQLETIDMYYVPHKYPSGKTFLVANPKIAPYETELYSSSENAGDKRYTRATDLYPSSANSLLGIAAASAPDPERQTKLYGLLAKTILEIHKNDPTIMGRWFINQAAFQINPANNKRFTSKDIFIIEDLVENPQTGKVEPRPDDERLMLDTENPDKMLEFWAIRQEDLQKALDTGKLEPYHNRWLEFLSHSVDMPKLLKIIKEESKKPIPNPLFKKRT